MKQVPTPRCPTPGPIWHPAGKPVQYPHEYVCTGTAKQLTLFRPASGEVRVKGVESSPNRVLHPWLEAELTEVLATVPEPETFSPEANRRRWERWQDGLTVRITLPETLPPLRMLLVLDNLTGHYTVTFVLWLFAHGIMPLYTPLGGSWLNMAESIQRILKARALDGQHPTTPEEIITWLEAAARGWNREPTPFIWGRQAPGSATASTRATACTRRLRRLHSTAHRLASIRGSQTTRHRDHDNRTTQPLNQPIGNAAENDAR